MKRRILSLILAVVLTSGCLSIPGSADGTTDALHGFSASGTKETLCVGQTDVITVSADPAEQPFNCEWSTDAPEVATVRDGVVTAVSPGTAEITVSACELTCTVRYTVEYHRLPAGTPVTERTATQPRQAVGHCSVCGDDCAVNVYEPAVFADTVPEAWYAIYVDDVYDSGLMNGVGGERFAPDSPMTRAMAATVLYRAVGHGEPADGTPFADVPEGMWYTEAVAWAAREGIVNGYDDGRFRPDQNITREQLATILYRYTQSREVHMASGAQLSAFPDNAAVHSYARAAMGWAVASGLINGVAGGGVTRLRPQGSATRAQFAAIVSRYRAIDWKPEGVVPGEDVYINGRAVPTLHRDGADYVAADKLADALELACTLTQGAASLGDPEAVRFVRDDCFAYCGAKAYLQTRVPFLRDGMLYLSVDELPQIMKLSRCTDPQSGACCLTSGGGDWAIPPDRKVPILAYHAVSNDIWGIEELFMDPAEMEKQLRYLVDNGYDPIWFEDLRHIDRYDKPVILTFDDGYADNFEVLLPLLKKYNVKATFFVIAGVLKNSSHSMTEQMVREAAASGLVSVQSHGMTHHDMAAMDEAALRYEFAESKRILTALTKREPYAVSYPQGRQNALTRKIAGEYFKFGTRTTGQLCNTSDDPLLFSRFNVARDTTLDEFAAMLAGTKG